MLIQMLTYKKENKSISNSLQIRCICCDLQLHKEGGVCLTSHIDIDIMRTIHM